MAVVLSQWFLWDFAEINKTRRIGTRKIRLKWLVIQDYHALLTSLPWPLGGVVLAVFG